MNIAQIVISALLVLIGVYVVARLASAAYFKSKHQFDNQQRKHPL